MCMESDPLEPLKGCMYISGERILNEEQVLNSSAWFDCIVHPFKEDFLSGRAASFREGR